MSSAAYTAAFKLCCEKEFGLSDKQVKKIIEDFPKMQKRLSDLEVMNRRKLVDELVHRIYDLSDEELSLLLEAMKKHGYYETTMCNHCNYRSFCTQRVALSTGSSELELRGCTAGSKIK